MSQAPAGRTARSELRIKSRSLIRNAMAVKLSALLKQCEPPRDTAEEPYDDAVFVDHMARLKQRINAEHFSPRERHAIFELLYALSTKLIRDHRLSAPPIYPPVTLTRMESKRTLANLHQATKLRSWNVRFKERVIATATESSVQAVHWLGLALWSALARSSLCDTELLEELKKRLCERAPLFEQSIGGLLAIRLAVHAGSALPQAEGGRGASDKPARRANLLDGHDYWRVHHFVPDGLTLALIRQWLLSDRKVEGRGLTLDIIRQAIKQGETPKAQYRTLAGLCAHASWLADQRPLATVNEAMGEVVSGRWGALGLDDTAHALLCGTASLSAILPQVTLTPYALAKTHSAIPGWVIHGRLQVALAKQGNRYPSRNDIDLALSPILEFADAGSVERLVLEWLLDLLKRGRKSSTIATYHSRITARLIDAFEGQSLIGLDASDFELAYRAIIDDIRLPQMREQVAGRLAQLHAFGQAHKHYRLPPLADVFEGASGVQFVRARHIPARFLPAIAGQIKIAGQDSDILNQYARMALLLAYRAGLRLGEVVKLRLRDIEQSSSKWLFIVENRFGSNKSIASRRQIPLAALLAPQELEEFKAFEQSRRSRSSIDAPLFANPVTGDPLRAAWLSQTVSTAMNIGLGGSGWTFHHLRHAAANNLFLAIEDDARLLKRFSGWEPIQCAAIRRAVLGNVAAKNTRYHALASFMGHADPRQTFESYLHLIEPLLAYRRARQPIEDERDLYAAAMRVSPGRLKGLKHDGDVNARLRPAFDGWVAKSQAMTRGRPKRDSVGRTTLEAGQPTIDQCRHALRIVELGGSLEDAALETQSEIATIEAWLANARTLANLKTKYGGPRLFHAERIARSQKVTSPGGKPRIPPQQQLLLPTDPKSPDEWHDCDLLVAHLGAALKNPATRSDAIFAIRHVLETADPNNSGVAFREPADLRRFLALFEKSPIVGSRWHLQLRMPPHLSADAWLTLLPEGAVHAGVCSTDEGKLNPAKAPRRSGAGLVRLHLLHPNWHRAGKGLYLKSTASTLRSVCHLLAIYWSDLAPERT